MIVAREAQPERNHRNAMIHPGVHGVKQIEKQKTSVRVWRNSGFWGSESFDLPDAGTGRLLRGRTSS